MATSRERKHPHIRVAGRIVLEERLPPWEAELMVAALGCLATAGPAPVEDCANAKTSARDESNAAH